MDDEVGAHSGRLRLATAMLNALRIEGTIKSLDPAREVSLLIMSLRGTWVKGNIEPQSSTYLHALLWSGGPVTVEGNIWVRGGISSVGRLFVKNNVFIDGRADISKIALPRPDRIDFVSWR